MQRTPTLRIGLGLVLASLVALGGLALHRAEPARASSGGRTGLSGNPATGGQTCSRCHNGGVTPDVAIEGPTTLAAGATGTYTLTIMGGQSNLGGFDVSATGGALAALNGATDVWLSNGEVTHTAPKTVDAMGQVAFSFLWTAPAQAGAVKLYGVGNSVNGNFNPSGDAADTATLDVTVSAGGGPDPTPTSEPEPATPAPTVESPYAVAVADLVNPHGITVLDEGMLLVGEGGNRSEAWVPGQFAPGAGDGRVSRIVLESPSQREVLVEDMTNSTDPGGGTVGGNHAIEVQLPGASTQTARVTLVAQAGGPNHTRPEEAAKILLVDASGAVEVFADPLAYEQANNPGGEPGDGGIDSNPWRLVQAPDGRVLVVDAGANDILALDLATRQLSAWAVFAPLTTEGQQAIPTGLAFAPDGDGVAYVSLLGPFGPGTTEIRRLEDKNGDGDMLDEGEQSTLVGGLKLVTDLAFGPGGQLFFTQIAGGTLSRIDPACWSEGVTCAADDVALAADRLPGASALAFLPEGDALVTTTNQPNPDGPSLSGNRIVRIPADQLLPEPEPTPTGPTPTPTEVTPTAEPPTNPTIFLPFLLRVETLH